MENQKLKINPAFRTHLARFKKNFQAQAYA